MEVKPKKPVRKKKSFSEAVKYLMSPEDADEEILNKSVKYSKQNKANRTKGHAFEREVVRLFKRIFPEARRNLEFQKEAAAHGVDLINTGRWHVQCKRGKRYVPVTAIDQVKICPIEGGCPILITKADHKPMLAVLPLDELISLIRFKERHQRKIDA